MKRITLERLYDVLHYDEETGAFTWKKRIAPKTHVGQRAGSINYQGYRVLGIDKEAVRAGRLAWFYKTGCWPNPEVDHKNRVRDDDRWENLREATRIEQLSNRVLN